MKFGRAQDIKLKVSWMSLIYVEGWKYLIKRNAQFNKGLLNWFQEITFGYYLLKISSIKFYGFLISKKMSISTIFLNLHTSFSLFFPFSFKN
jgi:hypothetical protein